MLQLWCYTEMARHQAAMCSPGGAPPPQPGVAPRACLVLNAATAPTPLDLAPYGAFYRSLKERCVPHAGKP